MVEPQILFLLPLKDTEVAEGEKAEFVVQTNCKPHTVKWYKNGRELKHEPEKTAISEDGNKFKLTIPKATKDDVADYKVCKIEK